MAEDGSRSPSVVRVAVSAIDDAGAGAGSDAGMGLFGSERGVGVPGAVRGLCESEGSYAIRS